MLRSMNCFLCFCELPSSVPSFICEHGAFLPLSFCLFYVLVAEEQLRRNVLKFFPLLLCVLLLQYSDIMQSAIQLHSALQKGAMKQYGQANASLNFLGERAEEERKGSLEYYHIFNIIPKI